MPDAELPDGETTNFDWRSWIGKSWYPGRPTGVVLYEEGGGRWRFALTTVRGGIVDGRLRSLHVDADEAKAGMLRQLRTTEAVVIDGEWTTDRPGWWSCRLVPAPERGDQ